MAELDEKHSRNFWQFTSHRKRIFLYVQFKLLRCTWPYINVHPTPRWKLMCGGLSVILTVIVGVLCVVSVPERMIRLSVLYFFIVVYFLIASGAAQVERLRGVPDSSLLFSVPLPHFPDLLVAFRKAALHRTKRDLSMPIGQEDNTPECHKR